MASQTYNYNNTPNKTNGIRSLCVYLCLYVKRLRLQLGNFLYILLKKSSFNENKFNLRIRACNKCIAEAIYRFICPLSLFPANAYYYVSKPISGGMANQMCTHLLILNRPHVTKYVRCLNKCIHEIDIRQYLNYRDFCNDRYKFSLTKRTFDNFGLNSI